MIMAYNVKDRVTTVMRWINKVPIYFFPYCHVGKKGIVKAFYNGTFINVNYKEALENCDGRWYGADKWHDDKTMMDKQLEALGIKTRKVNKASSKLGITEQLFVGRVSYN